MKILLVSFSNIGDAVLSLPVLSALSASFPEERIDIVVGPRAAVVFENERGVGRLLVYDKTKPRRDRWAFLLGIARERYDLVVDLRRSIFGFLGKKGTRPWTRLRETHRRSRHLEVLKALGFGKNPGAARMEIPSAARERITRLLGAADAARGPLVVIAPAARSDVKQWRAERFAELAGRLVSGRSARIVWIGDALERETVERVRSRMEAPSLCLAGEASWIESCEVLARADLVITNDSAPLHAADHLGRRVLAFFGPTDPAKYRPQGAGAALFRDKFCSPCEKAQCRFHRECLDEISVDEAYKKAVRLLDDAEETRAPKFLVVRLDRIGDALLTLPVFAALRKQFPLARISALVRPPSRAIAERCPHVDETVVYDYGPGGPHRSLRGYLRLVREIRRRRFDAAFLPHPTLRSHLLCFLAGVPVRIGYRARGAWLLTQSIPDRRHEGLQHEARNALDVLKPFGITADAEPGIFEVFAEDERQAQQALGAAGADPSGEFVVFHAGSSSVSKCWPKERFAALGRLMRDRWGAAVVLVGDARHAGLGAEIRRAVGEGCADLTGKTSLECLGAILRRAKVFISNDSGPVHLAAAVGARVVSIFGRNDPGLGPKRWRPLGKGSVALQKDAGCVVCLADACPIGFECLKALSVDEVFRAAARLAGREREGVTVVA